LAREKTGQSSPQKTTLMPEGLDQTMQINDNHDQEASNAGAKDGSIIRYEPPSTGKRKNKDLSSFLVKRMIPTLVTMGVGYGLCFFSLQRTIKSLQVKVDALAEFKKKAEQDPASKEFGCSQYAAIIAKENDRIYRDLKQSCMASPK
jgi:hypothetical protein